MSNYNFLAINKITKEEQPIEALDNYFGRHKYGYLVKDEILTSEEFFSKYDEAGVDVGGDTPDMMGEFTPEYHKDQLHKIGLGDTAEKELPKGVKNIMSIRGEENLLECPECGQLISLHGDICYSSTIPETEGWEKDWEKKSAEIVVMYTKYNDEDETSEKPIFLSETPIKFEIKDFIRQALSKATSSAYLAGVEKGEKKE